ncbi:MAG: hypothetical protein AAF490_00335 [Chloroflexota bacterium]
MKFKKSFKITLLTIILSLLVAGTVSAAPGTGPVEETAVFFAEAVNLPGWLGGILAVLSIILPIAAFQWMRQR